MVEKVLFLPHNLRHAYFHGFLRYAQENRGWRLGVVCTEDSRKAFLDTIEPEGQFFFLPNFGTESPWERDPNEVARIHSLIEDCEAKSGISVNRILLAGERDIGRAYSREFFYWAENALARRVRADPEQAQRILERMLRFVSDTFEEFAPELVVSGATASPLSFVTSLVAKLRGVPFLINRRCKVHARRCYWTLDRAMLSDLAKRAYRDKETTRAPVSDAARVYVENFHNRPQTVAYIENFWSYAAASKEWWNWHRTCAGLALGQIAHAVKRRKGQAPKQAWPTLIEFYRMRFLKLRQRALMQTFSDSELEGIKYVYFPFHKEPEMAINFQAYPWHSQIHTVEFLSALLPRGYKLLVREHRGTSGRRPTAFLRRLAGYPGVVVINPFDPQFKYIQNADLIITDNGSTGWEGILFGKPVITLHENFYDVPGLSTHVTAPGKLNQAILKLLRAPEPPDEQAYERRLGWFIDAQWETTFPDDDEHHADGFAFIETLLAGLGHTAASSAEAGAAKPPARADDEIAQAL